MSQPTWWRGGRGLPSLIALLHCCTYRALIMITFQIHDFINTPYMLRNNSVNTKYYNYIPTSMT